MTAATITPARIGNPYLRAALVEAGFTYEDLAARLGVDPKTVERWVNEPGRRPYARHAHAVAQMLGCDVWDLWPAQRPDTATQNGTAGAQAAPLVQLAHRALQRAETLNLAAAQPLELALLVGELSACLRGLTGLHETATGGAA
ncbi:helix-turn-helix transcriptional regulator [Streptomyces sp. SL13]|uniref:Helix-turn-helix transcriptional regulator n=1 Tax=Streptantibioticus silvisoli TaxID=2705255 RepID=A0AA90H1Y3_9ACTN|nr:helix-turn-helix transcriptional regulator [Streptantibioticus silvisoli]MDI5969503.1 helix-turn-helix transcriptional regulator [Streptantibioticus silvisoli]